MDISKEDAKEIVSQISILLGTKMNIMNSEGIIIASTDQSRIGTFHKAAHDIIKNNLHDYEISLENNELRGQIDSSAVTLSSDSHKLQSRLTKFTV